MKLRTDSRADPPPRDRARNGVPGRRAAAFGGAPAVHSEPDGAALDRKKGICDPPPRKTVCERWPEGYRLLNKTTGELIKGRCKATNKCDHCARLGATETTEMLVLDALEHAPTILAVLTARAFLTRVQCYAHLRQLRKAARRRWPGIEWAVLPEWQKRGALHLNLLIKGVPADELRELHELVVGLWCQRVDARPVGQRVELLQSVGGAIKYVADHFQKPEQAPPEGWKGHRFAATRGYLVRPASLMRQEARDSLALKRSKRAAERRGLGTEGVEAAIVRDLAERAAASWRMVDLAAVELAHKRRDWLAGARAAGAG